MKAKTEILNHSDKSASLPEYSELAYQLLRVNQDIETFHPSY